MKGITRFFVAILLLSFLSSCGGSQNPRPIDLQELLDATTGPDLLPTTGSSPGAAFSEPPDVTATLAATAVVTETATAVATETATVVATETASAVVTYQIGERAAINGLQVTLDAATATAKSGSFAPKVGQQFVIINATLENPTQSAIFLSPSQMTITDTNGATYPVDSMASDGLHAFGALIPAKTTIRGSVGYSIPTQANGLHWIFAAQDATIAATWDIGSVAGADASPTAIGPDSTANQNGQIYGVGEVATVGSVLVQVNQALISSGNQTFQSPAGTQTVLLNVSFKNRSSSSVIISSLLQTALMNQNGTPFSDDLEGTIALTNGAPPPEGKLQPGGTLRGWLGYRVPIGAHDLQWVFRSISSSDHAVFAIVPVPGTP